jgi:hypothetical protein
MATPIAHRGLLVGESLVGQAAEPTSADGKETLAPNGSTGVITGGALSSYRVGGSQFHRSLGVQRTYGDGMWSCQEQRRQE